jgi:hypothetical protein
MYYRPNNLVSKKNKKLEAGLNSEMESRLEAGES